MRRSLMAACLLFLLFTVSSCRTDYDISEVAPESFAGEACGHSDTCSVCSDHEHHDHGHSGTREHASDADALSGSEMHVHGAGERNHGTAWFFNQPWAASFIWGKLLRDSVVLVILAAAVCLLSGYRRGRR